MVAVSRQDKKETVEILKHKLKDASSIILTDYRGITVEEETALRRKFREAEVEYKVAKNTLVKLAVKDMGLDELNEFLIGPTSLSISYKDPVMPAKILSEFIKQYKKMELKAGVVDGKFINSKQIKALADLPSKEVLISKVLAGFNSPISGLVNVLQGSIRNLVYTLNAVKEKKEA